MWAYKNTTGTHALVNILYIVLCLHRLQDIRTLKLTPNPTRNPSNTDGSSDIAPFVCPMNLKEMNGSQPFVYLWTCGCVFSQAGLRAVSSTHPPREDAGKLEGKRKSPDDSDTGVQLDVCPQCATKYNKAEDVLLLNPSPEEEIKLIEGMIRRRASEPTKGKGKKRKTVTADNTNPSAQKKHDPSTPSINPNIATASRAVVTSLAKEEAKRMANMSDAVKSLYGPKDGVKRKETFMTMGTFTRVSHSFDIYSYSLAHIYTQYA